ncbi:hypothetical protein CVS30_06475 [Arthrobacter psychrolactophilus]|uniref:Uncharacterized protein n=1 Tax=Arthrobacter psychrolactophilus TaxID=92442 RepID=A0A2V5IQZ7_9MICC|nr:hypothetical protein [Arthrobacter psychrolactophilus]PYI38955.1 hypothetical protein CVS30_06475 [Arthrobacter psychrolactophilus]
MSAGTLRIDKPHNRSTTRAGYTSISSGTMTQLISAIASDAFDVPLKDVRTGIHSGPGQVSVSLAVPVALSLDPGSSHKTDDGGTLFERASSARAVVISRIGELAGTSINRVDIRFTGIQATVGRVQ